jgi:hypothetical protein
MLVASLSLAVVAQDEEPAPVTFVTGTVIEQSNHQDDTEPDPPTYVRGFEIIAQRSAGLIEQSVDWSDPRLPSEHWLQVSYQMVYDWDEEEGAVTTTTSHLMEDDAGGWTGSGRFVEDGDQYSFYALTGNGEYEGLYALLRGAPGVDSHGPWDIAYEGYIFEAEMLPFPAVPVPVETEGMQVIPFPMGSDPDRSGGSPVPSLEDGSQDVADPMAPAVFTVTLEPKGEPTWGTERDSEDGRTTEERGTVEVHAVEAADARASGVLTSVRNRNQMEVAGGGLQTYAFRMGLTNDGGEWSGTDHGVMAFAEGAFGAAGGVTVLTGEAGYEGLTLILDIPWSMPGEADTSTAWGIIVPSDQMPPMPDPIEPPAE